MSGFAVLTTSGGSRGSNFSPRYASATVVLNAPSPLAPVSDSFSAANNNASTHSSPKILLLGGDDYSRGFHWDTMLHVHDNGRETASGGFRNDVWMTDPTELQRSFFGRDNNDVGYLRGSSSSKSTEFTLQLHWNETNPGRNPPPNTTYEEWISTSSATGSSMWSPRRGHGAVVTHDDSIYVIGGRAREKSRVEDHLLVGGLQDHRFETLRDHPTQREEVKLKNDVWRSADGLGIDWELVSPGCGDHHQQDILLATELWSELGTGAGKHTHQRHHLGTSEAANCSTSADCSGVAECKALADAPTDDNVCVCPMFSAREHHSVSVQQRAFTDKKGNVHVQDYIFVVGGYTRIRQSFCGDHACNDDGYRVALDDAWVSTDGWNWLQIRPAFHSKEGRQILVGGDFQGRGGHSSVIIHSNPFRKPNSLEDPTAAMKDHLIILGGENSNPKEADTTYLNDIWSVELSPEPCCKKMGACLLTPTMLHPTHGCLPTMDQWTRQRNAEWSGRSGHATIYEPPSAHNAFGERMLVVGGINDGGVLSDVWLWNDISFAPGDAGESSADNTARVDPAWERDFAGPSQDHGLYQNYLSVHSEVSALVSYQLPDLTGGRGVEQEKISPNERFHLSALPLVSTQDAERMKLVGITTIQDLSKASVYDILKLRGIDNPWLEEIAAVHNICYLKALADAFVDKCSNSKITATVAVSTQKKEMYTDISLRNSTYCVVTLPTSPDECYSYEWNGCTPIDEFDLVDVFGFGNVDVPLIEHDPAQDLGELHCRKTPPARYMASSVFADNKAIIMGGRNQTLDSLYSDVWARDDAFPLAVIATKPRSYTSESRFEFSSTKSTAQVFEYKLFDSDNAELIPWQRTTTDQGADVSWLDWRNGGPGRGWYTLVVRAIDLSGNRDASYGDTNIHTWLYVPRPPIGKIFAGVFSFVFVVCVTRFEYNRREQKKALERYALRRARRKYRLKQSGDEWDRLANFQDKHFGTNSSGSSGRRGRSAGRSSRSRSLRDVEGGRASDQEVRYRSSSYGDRSRSHSRSRKRRRRRSVEDRHYSRSRSKSEYHRGKISERERERRRRKQHRRTRRETGNGNTMKKRL